jgi:putrescine transport system ATP-binding protein
MADELPKSEPGADAADIPLLRIDAVVKKFGAFRAVDRLSLDIRAGEFFALLGPSGCGKTTLLRMLAGFETPDEGRILLNGRDIAQVMPHQRPVNMMFQNYALFPHLSVRDNIAFGLKRAGMPRSQARSSASRWRARWRAARRCCCSTSRWRRSTRSCAKARSSN